MAEAASGASAAVPPRQKMSIWTMLSFGALIYVLFINPQARVLLGNWAGYVLDPVLGFDHKYPVLTIMLSGILIVVASTLLRHFTTDWLEVAKMQAYMRAFNQENRAAMKENNTYKLKVLKERMPELKEKQARMSSNQLKQTPIQMLISIPIFAWSYNFVTALDYGYFAAPWNPSVSMSGSNGILFGTSLFPHWILLSMALTIPFGFLVQRIMKYFAWRERWQKRHPEVHEG